MQKNPFKLLLSTFLFLVMGYLGNVHASEIYQQRVTVDEKFKFWVGCTLSDGTEANLLRTVANAAFVLIPFVPQDFKDRILGYVSLQKGEALCIMRHYDPNTNRTITGRYSHYILKFYRADGTYINGADLGGDCGGPDQGLCDSTKSSTRDVAAAFAGCFEPRFSGGVMSFEFRMSIGIVPNFTKGRGAPDSKSCEQRGYRATNLPLQ
jgi:hypothetical protein